MLIRDISLVRRKAFASTLVKRVRKAGSELMSKVPSRVSKRSLLEVNGWHYPLTQSCE